jgi:hypothetical protein
MRTKLQISAPACGAALTRALLLESDDLLVRLCATVPPPWFN